jgi:hypothetical protein
MVSFNPHRFLNALRGGGGDSTGSWLDEGRGRGGAMTLLLAVHRRGAAHNGGGRSNGCQRLGRLKVGEDPGWAKVGRTA